MGAARQLGRGEAGGVSCRPFSFNNLRWVYLAKSLAFNILDRFTAQGVTKLVESVACGQANTACLSLESFQVRERERERERETTGVQGTGASRVSSFFVCGVASQKSQEGPPIHLGHCDCLLVPLIGFSTPATNRVPVPGMSESGFRRPSAYSPQPVKTSLRLLIR
jgi:hypothetical protein